MSDFTHVPHAGLTPAYTAPLPNPLGGERHIYRWRGHQVAYVVRGTAAPNQASTPVLCVHSIHAAAWSAEWREVFGPLSERADLGPAYALDLLGFGASDRPPLHYSAALYIDLLRDFVRDVIGRPPLAIGSSLGATYLIALEAQHPGSLQHIVAIGPAGISRLYEPPSLLNRAIEALFRSTVPGTALFRLLVSHRSIRFFLRSIYANPKVFTPEVEHLYWSAANHPNARFAPAAFVGMRLSCDIRESVKTVSCPISLVWGTLAAQTPYKEAKTVQAALSVSAPSVSSLSVSALPSHISSLTSIKAGDLPHEECPEEFLASLQSPVSRLPSPVSSLTSQAVAPHPLTPSR